MTTSAPPEAQELFTDAIADDRPFNADGHASTDTQDLLEGQVFRPGTTRAERLVEAQDRVSNDPSLRYKTGSVKEDLLAQLNSQEISEQDAGLRWFQAVVVYTTVNVLNEKLQELDIDEADKAHVAKRLFAFDGHLPTSAQKWAIAKARQFISGEITELEQSERDYGKPNNGETAPKSSVAAVSTEATTLLAPPERSVRFNQNSAEIAQSPWFDKFVEYIKLNDPEKAWVLDVIAKPTERTTAQLKYAERLFFQITSRWEEEEERTKAMLRKQEGLVADLTARIEAVKANPYYPELWGYVKVGETKFILRDTIENPGNWETDADAEAVLRRVLAKAEKEFSVEIPAYVNQMVAELPLAIWFGVDEDWCRHLDISSRASEILSDLSVVPSDDARREFLLTPRGEQNLSRRYKCRTALDELFSSYLEFSGGANPYRLFEEGDEPYFEAAESERLMKDVLARIEQERIAAERRKARRPMPTSMPLNPVVYVSDGNDVVEPDPVCDLPAPNNKPRRKAKAPKSDNGESRRNTRKARGPASRSWQEKSDDERFPLGEANPQGDVDIQRGAVVAHSGLGQRERANRGLKKK